MGTYDAARSKTRGSIVRAFWKLYLQQGNLKITVKDITKMTGYIRGGCSPVGMKKKYPTVIDVSAELLPQMIVSAGKIGLQMQLSPKDLLQLVDGKVYDIVAE